jgi:hypothetical protein
MEKNPSTRHNSVDEILAIIDAGLAENEILAEHYKLNFINTNELPAVDRSSGRDTNGEYHFSPADENGIID